MHISIDVQCQSARLVASIRTPNAHAQGNDQKDPNADLLQTHMAQNFAAALSRQKILLRQLFCDPRKVNARLATGKRAMPYL